MLVRAVFSLFVVTTLLQMKSAWGAHYAITSFEILDVDRSTAMDFYDIGQVVLNDIDIYGLRTAYIWDGGLFRPLPLFPGATHLEAIAINNHGDVAGRGFLPFSNNPSRISVVQSRASRCQNTRWQRERRR